MTKLSADDIKEIMRRFQEQNPEPECELVWKNPYTLLVATVLSAQATDKSVNLATAPLFAEYDTAEKMLSLGIDGLIPYIRPIGLYNAKAKNIIALSKMLVADFGGDVPRSREELMWLPGVGRKTANVVLNVAFREKTMPVDTHVFRVSRLIGLSDGESVEEVEAELLACIPDEYLLHAHHWLLLHGRYVCKARKSDCAHCLIADVCAYMRKSAQ